MQVAQLKSSTAADPKAGAPAPLAEVIELRSKERLLRIVCIADTEGKHEDVEVPDGDILIHAGDFTAWGTKEELKKFNTWLGTLPHKHKVLIAGNHDLLMQSAPSLREKITNATYLKEESITIEGLKIYGSPYTPKFGIGAFGLKTANMRKTVWKRVPDDTDILVTHGPPKGIRDTTTKGQSVGDADLFERVAEVRPKLHVFGHIHEAYGTEERDGTTFINAACLNAEGKAANPAVVIDNPVKSYRPHQIRTAI
jgi:Icc-related predicted phosphoesterase